MIDLLNFAIVGGRVGKQIRRLSGCDRFGALAEHVRQLPYGRPSRGSDVLSVLLEQRGTCSSKHRLLATVAHESGYEDIELVVGLYAMSEENTPGVGAVLATANKISIPEAHCYLRWHNHRFDFTGLVSGSSSPFDSLIAEYAVHPLRLSEQKTSLHQEAISVWAATHGVTFTDAWELREACIRKLAT